MKLEIDIEGRVVHVALHQLRVPSIKLEPYLGETGWPDRQFFIKGGRPLLIEFKRPGEQPTGKQILMHEMLRSIGYDVQVHDNEDEAIAAIIYAMETA